MNYSPPITVLNHFNLFLRLYFKFFPLYRSPLEDDVSQEADYDRCKDGAVDGNQVLV